MEVAKKAVKRKLSNKKTNIINENIEKNSSKKLSDSEELSDSGTEDLLAAEVNGDGDSSDEEVGPNDEIVESDTERDEVVFSSGEEDELEFESDEDEDESDYDESEDESDDDKSEDDSGDDESEDESEDDLGEDNSDSRSLSDSDEAPLLVKPNKKTSLKSKQDNSNKDKTQNKKSITKCKKLENIQTSSNTKNVTGETKIVAPVDEYENDTSDEEDIRNTVGNIPMNWYNEKDHLGYDWQGKKILKPEKGDHIDNFIKRMEDPDFFRTIEDPQTGQSVVLSESDVDLIKNLPHLQLDDYAPWIEWFSSKVMKTPLRKFNESKSSFLPSISDKKKVAKLVHALKMGWIKSTAEIEKEKEQSSKGPEFYMLWKTDDQAEDMRRLHNHIPAPKRFLPGHAESYNPPAEYLFDNKELKQWNKLKNTPWKRKLHFIPEKYSSLRQVPAYSRFIKERFQRCLDLYLCPRALKMKLTIEPEDLVPQLPSPRDLQPFPTTLAMQFIGHTDMVRALSAEPKGRYIATGGDDMTVRIWDIYSGRCVKVFECGGTVRDVAWCPNQNISLIAVAADKRVLLINPGVCDNLITTKTDQLLEIIPQNNTIVSDRVKSAVQWLNAENENYEQGIRLILDHFQIVKNVTWHGKGDYFATVMPDGQNRSVLINQLSKRRSQLPFSKAKGQIQDVLFHPIRPFLFVATQRNVRIYDLVKQDMVKKLLTNSQWISKMAIHSGGDNLLVATYDRKILWFDLDLSTKPYQTLRLHGTGVRGIAFHKRYPLFASGADDRGLIVCHGMVYNDLLQNPLIVPLKRLCNHESFNDFGILNVMFHPVQPWVFSAGADSKVLMYK